MKNKKSLLFVALTLSGALVAGCNSPSTTSADPALRESGWTDKDAAKAGAATQPARAAPAESKTPEEASRRAADRKDPSGALIMAPGTMPPPSR